MDIRFWGVRGSIAVSGTRFVRTGGNTSCVEVVHDGHRLILDGGTGLRALGESLGFVPIEATVLFSHVHWDHIQGVPFFVPAYHPGSRLTLLGVQRGRRALRDALAAQMKPPAFPVTLDALRAELTFGGLRSGVPVELGPFRVTPQAVAHPGGTLALRVEAGGRSFVYATDIEVGGRPSRAFLRLCDGADVLVQDAQYLPEEVGARRGWGHSTWEEAVGVAGRCGVGRVGLFHHDPGRDDDAVAVIEADARRVHPGAFAAREGAGIALG